MFEGDERMSRQSQGPGQDLNEKHGWLYKIGRKNVVSSGWHRRYVCCRGQKLFYFKTIPQKGRNVPHKIFTLGTDCRVVDSGLERGHGKELYTFLVLTDSGKKWKLGAISPEECASWMGVIGRCVEVAKHELLVVQQARRDSVPQSAAGGLLPGAYMRTASHGPVRGGGSGGGAWDRDAQSMRNYNFSRGDFSSMEHLTPPGASASSAAGSSGGWGVGGRGRDRSPLSPRYHDRKSDGGNPSLGAGLGGRQRAGRGSEGMGMGEAGVRANGAAAAAAAAALTPSAPVEASRRTPRAGASSPPRAPQGLGDEGGAGRWRLIGLENGLRFFEEQGNSKGGPPCMKACGRVRAPSDAIFKLVMDLKPGARCEWDTVIEGGTVVESVDGHTDIIHVKIRPMWLGPCPCSTAPRDLVCTRYWRREADGTYVVLFRSTEHAKVPPQQGTVRAILRGGGYIISPIRGPGDDVGPGPLAKAKESVVMHLLELSPRGWIDGPWSPGPYLGLPRAFHRAMLLPLAGMRELLEHIPAEGHEGVWEGKFTGETGDSMGRVPGGEPGNAGSPPCAGVEVDLSNIDSDNDGDNDSLSELGSARGPSAGFAQAADVAGLLGRAARGRASMDALSSGSEDEGGGTGFRTPRGSSLQSRESQGASGDGEEGRALDSGSTLPRERSIDSLPESAMGCSGEGSPSSSVGDKPFTLEELAAEGYGGSLPRCTQGPKEVNCWGEVPGDDFRVRGRMYLEDKLKQPAGDTMFTLAAVDWFRADARVDNLCARPGGVCEKILKKHPGCYVFAVNLQVPAGWHFSMVFYYLVRGPPDPASLLGRFIHGDDLFRNARFKLIPSITEGAWVVKRSVGTTPLIVGGALQVDYHQGADYFECDVDIGSSAVAFGVVRFVLGYVKSLVVDMAFLVEAQEEEELPEKLLGTLRVSYLDPESATDPPPEAPAAA